MLREWSGWVDAGADPVEQTMLTDFARDLDHSRGDSWDEALKTGLARAYSVMREDATTILLVYTDAPPHTEAFAELGYSRAGYDEEQSNLSQKGSFRGCGNDFRDWASCGRTLASEHGKRVQTFCLTHCGMDFVGCCTYLSAMTGGANLELTDLSPEAISRTTVGLLLAWMQVQKVDPHAKPSPFAAKLVSYATEDRMRDIATETDAHAVKFFSIASLEIQRDPPPPPND